MPARFTIARDGEHAEISCRAVMTLGRDKNSDITINDPQASRNHAVLRLLGADDYYLIDSGSANGSFVNERRIATPVKLNDGDKVRIGSAELVFHQEKDQTRREEPGQEATLVMASLSIKQITILVSDIRGFTTLSEEVPINTLSKLMSEWFRLVSDGVAQLNGDIDKFIGDCVYARWEAGADPADSVYAALRAAQRIHEITRQLNGAYPELPRPLQIGVGINTGAAAVGVGRDNTAIGDAVNTTFRLESSSKELHTDVVLGESAYRLLPPQWWSGRTRRVTVKGKKDPVEVCAITFDQLAGPLAQRD
jgi:adenylate cyclase